MQKNSLKIEDKEQLIEFLAEVKSKNLKTTIIGAGSNTLFRDNGVKGVVIKLGNNFSYSKLDDKNIVQVGAATFDRKVADFAKENSLGNLEFLSCIPGSIGGAVIMNSGCYENDISKILISVLFPSRLVSELAFNVINKPNKNTVNNIRKKCFFMGPGAPWAPQGPHGPPPGPRGSPGGGRKQPFVYHPRPIKT